VRRGVSSALVAYGAARAARRLPEPTVPGWRRTNFQGREVTLATGRDAAIGLAAGLLPSPSAVLVVAAAAGGGAYDDLCAPGVELAGDKGLRGHLQAARSGRLSGGTVKVAVIGAGAVGAALLTPGRRTPLEVLSRAAMIAGTANLVNLFDLRPGRAAKIALALAVPGLGSRDADVAAASGAVTGAVLATLPGDLGEAGMLGDLGANALGAVLGLRLSRLGPPRRAVALVTITGLTVLSERVSFSRVIDSVPALRRLDRLGRR
jgi:UDP-N-acetylmuramyl pentapeptide phosphotransferase/UDP-N-acetylglucosamine-1-phosphate transferase